MKKKIIYSVKTICLNYTSVNIIYVKLKQKKRVIISNRIEVYVLSAHSNKSKNLITSDIRFPLFLNPNQIWCNTFNSNSDYSN